MEISSTVIDKAVFEVHLKVKKSPYSRLKVAIVPAEVAAG